MAVQYRRDTVELELKRIYGGGLWKQARKAVDRLVSVSLVWPRPLVAERVAARPHQFDRDGLNLEDRDWSERILFKENVEGPFGIVVQVSETLTAQQVAKITGALGAAVLQAAGSEAARLAAGPLLTSLARFPFTQLAGELSGFGKTPRVVASGRTTVIPGTPGPIDVDLTVPGDVVRVRRVRTGGRARTRREIIHRQGEPAGTVRLEATYYRG